MTSRGPPTTAKRSSSSARSTPLCNADPDGSGCSGGKDNCRLLDYHPTYWLINGKAYPDTDPIAAVSGNRLLLRYLNAGSFHQGMELLGAHQRVIAKDAFAGYPYQVVAETIPSGATLDAITIPCVLGGDDSLPLANANMRLTNVNASSRRNADLREPERHRLSGGREHRAARRTPARTSRSTSRRRCWTEPCRTTSSPRSLSQWTMESGPGTVTFGNAASVDTSASFEQAGTYVLRLTADDGVERRRSSTRSSSRS